MIYTCDISYMLFICNIYTIYVSKFYTSNTQFIKGKIVINDQILHCSDLTSV